ncbi:MAG: ParB/RepB/Spo0J family partition protein [Actinobacteria bacterium]|nr:ParB/RepB/Spo0J family partition protein [Actinomycetota bacterium]
MVTRRSGLGRGLDALLPSSGSGDPGQADGLIEVPIAQIAPNPNQPRSAFEQEPLEELARSIEQLGVLQPLLVRALGSGSFELIAGERRLRASKLAGLEKVPVVVVETDVEGSLERALVENIHRENLNPIEEAAAYRQLMDDVGLTQEALGTRIGKNRTTITNTLRLLDLPVALQAYLAEGRLTAGHGKALLGLDGNPFQERLARRVAQEELSVRETEDLVRRYLQMSGDTPKGGSKTASRPPQAAETEKRLGAALHTKVKVEVGKRKGKIVVEFSDLEDLDRLTNDILRGS